MSLRNGSQGNNSTSNSTQQPNQQLLGRNEWSIFFQFSFFCPPIQCNGLIHRNVFNDLSIHFSSIGWFALLILVQWIVPPTCLQWFHFIFLSGFIHYVEFGWIVFQWFNTPIYFCGMVHCVQFGQFLHILWFPLYGL